MADAKKCDLCGKLYEDYDAHADSSVKVPTDFTAISFKRARSAVNGMIIDVCPDCHNAIVSKMIELKSGIKDDKKGDKPGTLRDWMTKKDPINVNNISYIGGVSGCPMDYSGLSGHFKGPICPNGNRRGSNSECTECWNQPYIEDSKK